MYENYLQLKSAELVKILKKAAKYILIISLFLVFLIKLLGNSWDASLTLGLICFASLTIPCIFYIFLKFYVKTVYHITEAILFTLVSNFIKAHKGSIFGLGALFLMLSFVVRLIKICVE